MDFKDYYATLGVAKTATDKEIKQAFRKLARKFHPDLNPGDKKSESRFKDINEANEVLSDPEKRRKYDELGANWRQYEQAQQAGGPGFPPGGDWTFHFEGGGVHGAGDLGGDDPFSDFFKTFFGAAPAGEPGRRARAGRARGRPGRDVEQELQLTLQQAFDGVTQRLAIKHDGHARTVDVRIPAGIGDGSRVRIAGEGEHGAGGAPAGNLYLRIRVEPDPRFERHGRDLHAKVSVPLTTAVLGGEAEIVPLSGKPLRLKIPAATQNGQVFRLKGHGMPEVGKPDSRGDLYAAVQVQLPKHLSTEQKRLYEELRKIEHDT